MEKSEALKNHPDKKYKLNDIKNESKVRQIMKKFQHILNDEFVLGPIYDLIGLKWSLHKQNEYCPFHSHHMIMLLTKLNNPPPIDLNISLKENFEKHITDKQYLVN